MQSSYCRLLAKFAYFDNSIYWKEVLQISQLKLSSWDGRGFDERFDVYYEEVKSMIYDRIMQQ